MKMKVMTMSMVLLVVVTWGQELLREESGPGYRFKDLETYVVLEVNPDSAEVCMYYLDNYGRQYQDFNRVDPNDTMLVSLCNGGMFMEDHRPLGLYVDAGKELMPVNRRNGTTNFYIQPNGIFEVMDNGRCRIILTEEYADPKGVRYATQSGPILVMDSIINQKFSIGSTSFNSRNGIGIRKDGTVVILLSLRLVNFYQFAELFQQQGCIDALYLDGAISGMWYGEKYYGYPTGFGVMIGVRNTSGR